MKRRFPSRLVVIVPLAYALLAHSSQADAQAPRTQTLILDRCPVSQATRQPEEAAVTTLFLLKLVERIAVGAVDVGANLLKEAASDKNITSTVTSSGYLYRSTGEGTVGLNPDFACLVFYRGVPGAYAGQTQPGPTPSGYLAAFAQQRHLKDLPDIYFEAFIQPSADNGYFRLQLQAFRYAEKSSGFFAGGNSRSAVLTVSFHDPTRPAAEATFASTTFPAFAPTAVLLGAEELANSATGWMPLAPIADKETAVKELLDRERRPAVLRAEINALKGELAVEDPRLTAIRKKACDTAKAAKIEDTFCPNPYQVLVTQYNALRRKLQIEDTIAGKSKELDSMPSETSGTDLKLFDWQITLVETERPGDFVKLLARATEEAAPGAKQALERSLDPEKRATQLEAELAAKRKKLEAEGERESAAITALGDAQIAEAALADLPLTAPASERARLQADLRLKKLKANTAYKLIGHPEPYPSAF